MPTRAKAPVNVNSCYIMVDVPQGLGMLVFHRNRISGVRTGFRAEGRSVEGLGHENIMRILANC